jgi:DNA-binding MarR family transcriptional regulator
MAKAERDFVATTAKGLFKVLGRLRDRHADMTVLQAMVFLAIAEHPGITQAELSGLLAVRDSTVSRAVAMLSDIGVRNVGGLDLIEVCVGDDRRNRELFLTPKGTRLLGDFANDIGRGR